MKKIVLLISVFILVYINESKAQRGPLRGNGVPKTLTYNQEGYDKVNLMDFEGNIQIEIGKKHSVTIVIDENIAEKVEFNLDQEENELSISIAGNKNGRLYLEDINSTIKITMPEASVIKHRGNSKVYVSGVLGRYFRMEQQGNGDVVLEGKIDELDITKIGNGTVFAENLITKEANITSLGNGNVKINASDSFTAKGTGNGDVVQIGKGTASFFSKIVGNGKIIRTKA